MAKKYSFVTVWKFKAPVEKIYQAIRDSEQWPVWWRGVESVKVLQEGDENGIGKLMNYTFKSALPYSLSFDTKVEKIEKPKTIIGTASGELDGRGEWNFEEKDGITTATYYWDVSTTKPWMNFFSPIMEPAFKWNHDVIMNWGAEGLAKYFGIELLEK